MNGFKACPLSCPAKMQPGNHSQALKPCSFDFPAAELRADKNSFLYIVPSLWYFVIVTKLDGSSQKNLYSSIFQELSICFLFLREFVPSFLQRERPFLPFESVRVLPLPEGPEKDDRHCQLVPFFNESHLVRILFFDPLSSPNTLDVCERAVFPVLAIWRSSHLSLWKASTFPLEQAVLCYGT